MFKTELTEETRYGLIILMALVALFVLILLLNYFLGGQQAATFVEKEKDKTVIVTQAKEGSVQPPQKLPAKSVVSTVRDAIKLGNYSTAYMEIHNVSKTSPEYEELSKMLAEETQRRKAPGVHKETGVSASAQIRYFDETTPRNRTADAVYVYFVDIAGTLWPRFCIQSAAKRPLGVTGFTIAADNKKINISASSVKLENIKNGVSEWYDVPLDQHTYDAVQAMIRAKKSTLTTSGNSGNKTRDVTESEVKGMRRILDGYAALGGNLNYLQVSKPLPPAKNIR